MLACLLGPVTIQTIRALLSLLNGRVCTVTPTEDPLIS